MTKTVTMMEKVTKIMMKSRYSPIRGITCREVEVNVTNASGQRPLMFEIYAFSTECQIEEIH